MTPHSERPMATSTQADGRNGVANVKANGTGLNLAANQDSPLPTIPDLDSKSYSSEDKLVEDIIEGMKVAGGCIVRHLIDPSALDKIDQEIHPLLESAQPWNGGFWPPQNRNAMGLLGKSEHFALNIVGNPVYQKVGEYFLTSVFKDYWIGDDKKHSISKPQLNNTIALRLLPGAKGQGLHRDDIVQHNFQPAAKTHTLGRDTTMGFFVAGSRSTQQNGATRVVPGSHLWDYSIPLSDESMAVQVELERGDAFLMLAGCFHGGSENKSTDDVRTLYVALSTRGYFRQEENQYLANDMEKVKRLPLWLQKFAGYSISEPFMGWVEMDDPIRVLHPDMPKIEGDLY